MVYHIDLDEGKKTVRINDQQFPIRWRENEKICDIKLPVSRDQYSGKLTLRKITAGREDELVRKIRESIQISRGEMGLRGGEYTVWEYYKMWKEESRGALSQGTRQKYEDAFRNEVCPFFANMRLEEIDRKVIDEWRGMEREKGSERSFAQGYRLLRQMLDDAESKRYIPARPWMPRQEQEKTDFRFPLTKDQQDYIHENREKDLLWTMIYVSERNGLRPGEIIVLQDCDCDFQRKILWVRHQYTESRKQSTDGAVHKPYTKTKHIRAINLDDECLRLIRKVMQEQEKIRYRHLVHFSESFLFLTEEGSFFQPKVFRDAYQSRMEGTGPKTTPHSLRNTCACNLYEKDGKRDLAAVMRQLGVTEETALRYISETRAGTTFVATALEKWILTEMEEKEMVGDEKEKQWELFYEEPYMEAQGNRVFLSAASVGLIGHMPYVKMGLNEENMQLTVRGSTIPLLNLPMDGHKIPQKEDRFATAASWYVPGFAARLEGLLGEEYKIEQGVRMVAQYNPEERSLLFDLHNTVQMKDESPENNQPEKKKRGRRKTIHTGKE